MPKQYKIWYSLAVLLAWTIGPGTGTMLYTELGWSPLRPVQLG